MANPNILVKQGIKNRFKLKESDFLNIPSIKSVDLGNQPLYYEAYVYLIKDLWTGERYIGVHKKTDKTYWTSMTHKVGLSRVQGSEERIEYKILEYGTYSVMKNKEADDIDKHDAVAAPDWWNQMHGMYHKEDIDLPKCIKFAKNIENGKFSENTEKVKDLVKLPTWQVRDEEYIPKSLKYIKSKIKEKGGSTEKCNHIIILDERLNPKIYSIVDLRIDGAHTLKAADDEGSLDIKTYRIPKKIHKDFTNNEIITVASLLNKDDEVRKEPNSKETNARVIFERWLSLRWEIDCDDNIEFLKSMGKSTPERNKIFEIAEELKTSYEYENEHNIVLIDYQEADKQILKDALEEKDTDTTIPIAQSSKTLRYDRAQDKLQDDKKKRKHLVYFVYHSSFISAEKKWKDEKKKLEKRLDYWLVPRGYTYEIIEMEYKKEKVVL
jgi:hypothetical protein|tara:strand:+ start:59 stop:1372 length:1314 start_codon:yes stop_codon:yes gene_type:complete